MLALEDQRRPGHEPLELGEGDDGAGEGDGADGHAQPHLDQGMRFDGADLADTELMGREIGRGRDADRRQADQAVEGGHELRQGRHLDAQRNEAADGPADDDARRDDRIAHHPRLGQGRGDGDHHAGDAEAVAAARGLRRGQAPERHDEADGGDEISEGRQILSHAPAPTSSFS